MRKIAAIFLILILLFNIAGYRVAISFMQQHSDQQLETQLDQQDYNESDLVEIRVAMNMPYQQRFTDFERHYGQIEINGKSYTYVKKKIEGDIVIFKCIANESRQQLKSLQDNLALANSNTDLDHPGQQKQVSFAKNFWSEYDEQQQPSSTFTNVEQSSIVFSNYQLNIPSPATTTEHQPPEFRMS